MDEKRKKELTERITKSIEEARQQLLAVEAYRQAKADKVVEDIQQSEVSKEYKARSDPKSRLAQLTSKSKEEIIKSGTPKEIAFLYIAVPQKPKLEKEGEYFVTDAESDYMRNRLSDPDAFEVARICDEYEIYEEIEKEFKLKYLVFNKDVAVLSILAKQWETYEREADVLTRLFKSDSPDRLKEFTDGKTFEEKYKYIDHIAKHVGKTFEGIQLAYDRKRDEFFLNDTKEEGLMQVIAYRSACLKKSLRDLKGYIEAIERRLKLQGWSQTFLPIDMAILIRDTKNEATLKAYGVSQEYLKSHLNQRIIKGEKVTKVETLKAIFPDYYELSCNKMYYDLVIGNYFDAP